MLTRALRRLEGESLVSRLPYDHRVEYVATYFGIELCQLLEQLESLALSHLAPPPDESSPDSSLSLTPLAHLSIAVRDMDVAAQALAVVLGCGTPSVLDLPVYALTNRKEHIRVCRFRTANLDIELLQHRSGSGPFRDFIERFGPGVEHLAFETRANRPAVAHRLELLGGRRTAGDAGDSNFTNVDFRSQLGMTIELLTDPSFDAAGPPCDAGPVRVTHLRAVVRDVRQAAGMYGEVFQLPRLVTKTVTVRSREYRARRLTAHSVRMAELNLQGITIGLMEPVDGPAIWRNRLSSVGNGIYHLGLSLGRRPLSVVKGLRELGGRAVDLRLGGERTFVDLTPQLGLIIEMTETAPPARSARRHTLPRG